MSTSPPPVVADRYRLVAPLGQGGMGRVWRATDVVLHRDVAIKELVPPPGLTPDERREMRERSLREARAIARLNNVNVVRVFDVLRTDADPWIVMEYVPSRSLQDILAADGPLPPVRAAEVGLGVLNALRAAHRNGVVHRDVKPGNVLIGEDGRVVLTDFGLATVPGDPNVTRTGLVLGSPAYIAPERARDGTAGPGADLWSLGATLYAAVEGASPFARPSAIATLAALATENPPTARNAGPLKPVLNGLLRKDPTHRINAEEAERLLLRASGRRSKLTFPMSPTMRRPGIGRERPALPGAPPIIPGGSTVSGSAPVVPGPRPPVVGRPPAAGRPAAQPDDGRRPPVFVPGKASVGRPVRPPADNPTRVDAPPLDATRVDTPPIKDFPTTGEASPQVPVRPGPEVSETSRPGNAHGALGRGTRGAFGTISAAEVAAHRKKAAPQAPAASAAATPVANPPVETPAPAAETTGPAALEADRTAVVEHVGVHAGSTDVAGADSGPADTVGGPISDTAAAAESKSSTASDAGTEPAAADQPAAGAVAPKAEAVAPSGPEADAPSGPEAEAAALGDERKTEADAPGDEPKAEAALPGSKSKTGAAAAGTPPRTEGDDRADQPSTETAAPAGEPEVEVAAPVGESKAGTAGPGGGPTTETASEAGGEVAPATEDATEGEAVQGDAKAALPRKPTVGARAGKLSRKKGRGRTGAKAAGAVATAPTGGDTPGDGDLAANSHVVPTPADTGAAAMSSDPAAPGDTATAVRATKAAPPKDRPVPAPGEKAVARKLTTAAVPAAKSATATSPATKTPGAASPAGTAIIGVPPAPAGDTAPAPRRPATGLDGTRVPGAGASASGIAATSSGTGGIPGVPASRRPAWQPMAVSQRSAANRGITVLGTTLTRRQTVIGVAILAAVLLALILVVPRAFGGDAGDGNRNAGVAVLPPASASSTGQASAPAAPPVTTAPTSAPASAPPSSAPAPSSAPPADALPRGFYRYKDPSGFSVPLPVGWKPSARGTELYFRDGKGGGRLLIIDQTDQPKADPVADWTAQESERRGKYRNYQRIRIDAVQGYFDKAADWEFRYTTSKGNPQRAQKRGFVTGPKKAYGISWYTSPQDWEANKSVLEIIYKGFVPARS